MTVVLALGAGFLLSSNGSDGDTTASGSNPPTSAAGAPVATTLFGADDHSNLPPEGCEQLKAHSGMGMWDAVLADQLLDYDCAFPVDPSLVSMEGGQEDPSIAAPFEPRRYKELFDTLNTAGFGMCTVARTAEPSERGFVYGFTISVHSPTCAENNPDVQMIAREYASRAHRDEAANTLDAAHVMALGRWVVTVDGANTESATTLAAAIAQLGASTV
jgi:hypothetical protein